MGEVMAACNEGGVGIAELGLEPGALAELIGLVGSGTLSNNLGKQVLRKMIETGKAPEQIIDEDDLSKVSDVGQIEAWVAAVIEDNPKEVERYRRGEEKLLSFFIGQVMQKSKGRADPARLREVLLGAINRDWGG